MSTTKHKALVTFEKHEHALACRRKFHRYVCHFVKYLFILHVNTVTPNIRSSTRFAFS